MKKVFILLLSILLFNCSSDDDSTNLDLNLLHGQWYRVGFCQEQNSLLLEQNGNYTSYSSGAVDCDDPEPSTYKYTGTYAISGNFYQPTELTREVIIEGTVLSVSVSLPGEFKQEIIELTTDILIIKWYLKDNDIIYDQGVNKYQH